MANNLGKVIYLSEAQKETLFTNGTITVRGQTIEYNDYDLYVTPSEIDIAPVENSNNLITSGAVFNAIEEVTQDYRTAAAQDVIDATKAPLNSPTLIGTPTAPTPDVNDNSTKIATTAFVQAHTYIQAVTYGIAIDESNSNPLSCVTYLNDAVGMTKGSATWDDMPIFKDIRPCVFQNGAVNYYLDRNNFNYKEDGTASVLTGADGDVMIEFPKFAYKIFREGTTLYVVVSNDETVISKDNRFTYGAFSRLIEGDLNHFYYGAYKGYVDSNNKLRSIKGVKPTANLNIGEFRTRAQANGAHYQQTTWYHLVAVQCLYLIKYGDLNGQAAIGSGVTGITDDGSSNLSINTGGIEANGMAYAGTNTQHMKVFGIEDFWGNIWEWVDGLTTDASRNLIASWNSYSNEGVTATSTSTSTGLTANLDWGWVKTVSGTTHGGFMPTKTGGSSTTYWADVGYLCASCVLRFGGAWGGSAGAGPFYLYANHGAGYSGRDFGGRLSFS